MGVNEEVPFGDSYSTLGKNSGGNFIKKAKQEAVYLL